MGEEYESGKFITIHGGQAKPAKVSQKVLDQITNRLIEAQDEAAAKDNDKAKAISMPYNESNNKLRGFKWGESGSKDNEKYCNLTYNFDVNFFTSKKGSIKMLKALGKKRYGKDYEKHVVYARKLEGLEEISGLNIAYLTWPSRFDKMIDEISLITPKIGGLARLSITLKRPENGAYDAYDSDNSRGFFDQQAAEIYNDILDLSRSIHGPKKSKEKNKLKPRTKKSKRSRRDRRYSKPKANRSKRVWP